MPDECNNCENEKIISQLLKVQAEIIVTPLVDHGRPKVFCIDSCIKQNSDCCCERERNFCFDKCCDCDCDDRDRDFDCDKTWRTGKSRNKYNYTVTQIICVEIPVSIDVDVDVDDDGIVCCKPDIKSTDD